jgi:cytochrome P450
MQEIPSPPGHFLLGNLPDVMGAKGMGPTETLMHLGLKYAPLFQLKVPGGRMIVASGAEMMDEICDESRFDKAVKYELEVVRELAGDGLFTANTEDPNWKKAHNILMPSFSAKNMKEYLPTMDERPGPGLGRSGPGADGERSLPARCLGEQRSGRGRGHHPWMRRKGEASAAATTA